jgi:hypothetical protein
VRYFEVEIHASPITCNVAFNSTPVEHRNTSNTTRGAAYIFFRWPRLDHPPAALQGRMADADGVFPKFAADVVGRTLSPRVEDRLGRRHCHSRADCECRP